MILQFPKFSKFQFTDRAIVENITKEFPPYCEYSLISLLTWYNIIVSTLNNNLVLKLEEYFDDDTSAYSVLGTENIDETIKTVITEAIKLKHEPELIMVPEPVKHALQYPANFKCVEDRNMFDYIVSIEEMATLKGGCNQTKRELFKLFSKRYPGYVFKIINLNDKKTQNEIANLYSTWRKNANKTENFLDHEYQTVHKLYATADQLDIIAHGLYHNSTMIGFSVIGLVNKPYAIHYYLKTDIRYRGVTVTFNKLLGEYLWEKGYLYLNLEADLGIPGLRKSKMLRHPVEFLKKFTIRVAEK